MCHRCTVHQKNTVLTTLGKKAAGLYSILVNVPPQHEEFRENAFREFSSLVRQRTKKKKNGEGFNICNVLMSFKPFISFFSCVGFYLF